MNELKKGDRCNTMHGAVTIDYFDAGMSVATTINDNGQLMRYYVSQLTRIPTHAERMHKVIDIAFDAENRLEPHETVQLTVGDLAAFVRHYCHLRNNVDANISSREDEMSRMAENNAFAKKLLKGEA
jgi:hypothetical protein